MEPRPHTTRARAVLEQGGWPSLPDFAFFFRNGFDVVNVRTSLGQDMVQIVAQAEEGKALLEELANAGCAKQKDAKNDIILAGVLDQLLRGCSQFGRSVHVREFIFVIETHRHAEIILSEKKNIDARNSGNLGDVFYAGGCLHLKSDDAFIVPFTSVAK